MKTKELFNRIDFNNALANASEYYPEVNNTLAELKGNGLEISLETLPKYLTISEEDFRKEITAMRDNLFANLGGILLEEKKRISKTYADFADRMYPMIAILQNRTKNYNLVFKEDSNGFVVVDEEAVEKELEKQFTKVYNLDELENYWKEVKKVMKAISVLKAYEDEHLAGIGIASRLTVLDDWTINCAARGESTFLQSTKGAGFCTNPTKEYLEEVCLPCFEIRK